MVVARLSRYLHKRWEYRGGDDWRENYAKMVKEIPMINNMIRYIGKILKDTDTTLVYRRLLAIKLKRTCPRIYSWGLSLLGEDFVVLR
jgi:hypothetical protein